MKKSLFLSLLITFFCTVCFAYPVGKPFPPFLKNHSLTNPFIDPDGYKKHVAQKEHEFYTELQKQKSAMSSKITSKFSNRTHRKIVSRVLQETIQIDDFATLLKALDEKLSPQAGQTKGELLKRLKIIKQVSGYDEEKQENKL